MGPVPSGSENEALQTDGHEGAASQTPTPLMLTGKQILNNSWHLPRQKKGTTGSGIYGSCKLLFSGHSLLVCPFLRLSLSAQAEFDGKGAARRRTRMTERSCPTATNTADILRGVRQLSVRLGLRGAGHWTGRRDVFIAGGPEVFGGERWLFGQTGFT